MPWLPQPNGTTRFVEPPPWMVSGPASGTRGATGSRRKNRRSNRRNNVTMGGRRRKGSRKNRNASRKNRRSNL